MFIQIIMFLMHISNLYGDDYRVSVSVMINFDKLEFIKIYF